MLINVRLLNGYKETFTYTVPTELASENLVGTLIKVPFQKRIETALVCEQFEHLKNPVSFALRTAHSLEPFPQDAYYQQFIKQLSIYYALDPFYFFKRVRIFLKEKEEIEQSATSPILEHRLLDVTLSEDQKIIVTALTPIIESPRYYPSLLHGVTGSGKTEIYKQLIMHALSCNKSVLLLLPEVSLAVQFTQLLKKQLPESVLIFGFHSATSIKEK
nr:DEAD/DEAH box helicase family protein [Tatlockia sp.]